VKNLIDAGIARLTRKNCSDNESVKLWIEKFKQENYSTLLHLHKNGPYLLSWVSLWQKKAVVFRIHLSINNNVYFS
jgi:hypothetical protein